MKLSLPVFIKLLILHWLTVLCISQDFDFFYFVQQWPGSYCDTKHSCCYPKTGKPASDFGIHGLWPNHNNGSYPQKCNRYSALDKSQISELTSTLQKEWPSLSCANSNYGFWSHEWKKHGTCAESELGQRDYFEATLKLKQRANLLQALKNAGIKPDDEFYDFDSIKEAIKGAVGFTPWLECKVDQSKNARLFQVYLCVDTSGSDFIECPRPPRKECQCQCQSRVQFPKF